MDTKRHPGADAPEVRGLDFSRWRRHLRRQRLVANSFGCRLRQARKKRGLTQARLARRTGLSPAAIAEIERDVRPPWADELRRIALALGMSIEQLVDG